MSRCGRVEEIRDYAMGEAPAEARAAIESHTASCEECAGELQRLRLTTAALRSLPDEEIPQRIAFVSDKVFEPSPVARFFQGFWNSTARLGFASACMLAVAIMTFALRQPAAAPVAPQVAVATKAAYAPAVSQQDIARQIDQAVAKAVTQVREQDAQLTKAALEEAEARHQKEHQALMVAMQESMTVLQKRLSTYTMLASNYQPREAAGQ